MSVYKRGNVYWFEFEFMGQRVRDSAHSSNRELARSIERNRRRAMEESAGGVKKVRPILFRKAGKRFLKEGAHLSESTVEIYKLKLSHLLPSFGRLLLTEITPERISKFQSKRRREHASNREVNMELGVVRMVLRKHRLWHLIEPDYHPLPESEEIGVALTLEEANKILEAAANSRSRSLFPALMIYLHTGVRSAELRKMRWRQVDLIRCAITVGKSKTPGGEGRSIPLHDEAFEILLEWHSRFPDPQPDHFVFPSERYGFDGNHGRLHGKAKPYALDPTQPMGSWKSAWTTCRKTAGVW